MNVKYEIHPKENAYFVAKIIAACIGYYLIYWAVDFCLQSRNPAAFLPLLFYALLFGFYMFFHFGILIGYIKGNGVKITGKQFPEINEIVQKQCFLLGIKKTPDVYILQSGGVLNAFATSWFGSDYVVIYSDVLEEAYEKNMETVEFIIGHELGHIKRKHLLKRTLLFPSLVIPFLGRAYSRACEYTCDNIGATLSPQGVKNGLLVLSAGKKLWKKVNADRFVEQETTEDSFWFWFAEKVSTHPRLTKRLSRFNVPKKIAEEVVREKPIVKEVKTDHNSYLPK
jgi:Zn-dependent protease with chaperone function